VGEPWNAHAVDEGIGFVMATSLDIYPGHAEKVLGVREEWANQYPQTHVALVKALLEACDYCDDRRYREEVLELVCRPEYVGGKPEYTRRGFIDPYNYGTGAAPKQLLSFNQFYVNQANYPNSIEMLWVMTQMARWGLIPFPRNWVEIVERVRRVDTYGEAARSLGLPDSGRDRTPIQLFDGTVFNPDEPIQYLNHLSIKREIQIEEMVINTVAGAV
jgi:NMT1-like family